ncbi:rab9 effector protein with kelch motifs [Chanos chanos]|uniref:Rab9 effector protein with kelch motifs n=1 Tax=Chanos chanos TaxID=29144 RepID=A0A6J2WHM8_CHACN|nr:rab9 effector protein with kelch motifs-like [Chanos chanos]
MSVRSKSNRSSYQVHMPLPLPKQLVIFSLGEWTSFSDDTTISIDVQVSQDVKPQRIGTLSPDSRCLIWEGDWTLDLLNEASEKRKRGVYAKVLLTVRASFVSSTPLVPRKRPAPDQSSNLSPSLLSSGESHIIKTQKSALEESVSYADLKTDKGETQDISLPKIRGVWPTDKTPRRTVIGRRGHIWSSENLEGSQNSSKAASPKKRKLSTMSAPNSDEENANKRRKSWRKDCPSERWSHTMCLSDPETAVVIGGETDDQTLCKDSMWKLEIESDFWFPMDSSMSGPCPLNARGHSATFDPESKVIYVYGGLREGQRFSDVYILDTKTWKWRLINAKGKIPTLAYHSATIYKKELFVFGGIQPSRHPAGQACSNALYIFNPEYELWYQPITEGERPLPRFGHSTTLLSNKLIIFGGRKTATYLNDLHVLDLGFMEYSTVKCANMAPLPRGFHAALPVSDNRILISGGCSAIGALQDLHLFNLDTNLWTSLVCQSLCTKPRAGHSLISLGGTTAISTDQCKQKKGQNTSSAMQHTILVFGGSDCAGTFYSDTVKCTVEIPAEETMDHTMKCATKTCP